MSTTKQTSSPPSSPVLIGRDIGPLGRVFRLVAGGLLVAGGIAWQLADPDLGAPAIVSTAGYLVALAAFYLVLHQVLGERVLARVDPVVGTVLVLAPLGVLALSVFPEPLHVAITLYVGASLVLSAIIRYGGCEMIALPTVLSGRRYVVYCPINIVDAAERPLHGSRDLRGDPG